MAKPTRQETAPERRNRVHPVGAEARIVGQAAFARAGFADETLILHWSDIVGPDIARLAHPLRLSGGAPGGVLTLGAEPAAAVFLQHESRTLLARINAYLGRPAVARIRFVEAEGQLIPQKDQKARSAKAAVSATDPARTFEGPERLKLALLALAKMRQSGNPGD